MAQFYAGVAADAPELVQVLRVPVVRGRTVEAQSTIGVEAFARWQGEASRRVPADGRHTLTVATSSACPGMTMEVTIANGEFHAVRIG